MSSDNCGQSDSVIPLGKASKDLVSWRRGDFQKNAAAFPD